MDGESVGWCGQGKGFMARAGTLLMTLDVSKDSDAGYGQAGALHMDGD